MMKIGRNSPCPCGSSKKYKRCCEAKEAELRKTSLPRGRFRYEHGSYGGPGGYMPSILCYRETGPESWVEHFCLVKAGAIFGQEDSACEAAEKHLAEARAIVEAGGSVEDFALSLRHEGYKSASDFRVIKEGKAIKQPISFSFARENESTPPSDEQIEQVSRVLSEWNPLGDNADNIPDLNGYRTEAEDILFYLYFFGPKRDLVPTVRDIVNQAFDLFLSIDECRDAATRIAAILEKND